MAIKICKVKRRYLARLLILTVVMCILSHLFMKPIRTDYNKPESVLVRHLENENGLHADGKVAISDYRTALNQSKPQNIFFLKLHKCASSTVQNILMRYGDKHHLNFVLPYCGNYMGHPEPFDPIMAMPLSRSSDQYNIFCHHTRFNLNSVHRIMPSNTIYLAIIRDPVDLFESLYSYVEFAKVYGMSLETYSDMPRWWIHAVERIRKSFGNNQMAFDFGMSESDFANAANIEQYIWVLEKQFDLVMVAEYFDESLILLKNLLNMDIQDIVYFSLNERFLFEKQNLTDRLRSKIRDVNHVDQIIYDRFLELFRQRMKIFGEKKLMEQVAELRQWNRYWYVTCGTHHTSKDEALPPFRPYSDKVKAFKLQDNPHSKFCESLAKAEIPFTMELRSKHIHLHGSLWHRLLYAIGLYER